MTRVSKKFVSFLRSMASLIQGRGFSVTQFQAARFGSRVEIDGDDVVEHADRHADRICQPGLIEPRLQTATASAEVFNVTAEHSSAQGSGKGVGPIHF